MKTYSNILDTILDTPNHATLKQSAALGDAILDADTRFAGKGKTANSVRPLKQDVAEAVTRIAAEFPPTAKFKNVEQVVRFANVILAKKGSKIASNKEFAPYIAAASRVIRLASKTPEQMEQDGVTKLAEYLNPQSGWSSQFRSDIVSLHKLYNVIRTSKKAKLAADAVIPMYNGSIVNDRVNFLTETENGLDYLGPAEMMTKNDTVPGGARLTPSRLANADSRPNKTHLAKKAMVKAGPKVADATTARIVANPLKPKQAETVRTSKESALVENEERISKSAAPVSFTASDALTMHKQGKTLPEIYQQATKTAGVQQAKLAVQKFIANLKTSKAKVSLTQIDCTMLKGKLATNNAIIGAAKCASCSYRTGMHCGLTGGTLLSFPGIEKTKSNHRVASNSPKDGYGLLNEFDMFVKKAAPAIELNPETEETAAEYFPANVQGFSF